MSDEIDMNRVSKKSDFLRGLRSIVAFLKFSIN